MSPEEQERRRAELARDPETGGIVLAHLIGHPEIVMAALTEFADRDKARIAFDTATLGDGTEVEVSTVDLVFASPGGAFETAVFVDGEGPQYIRRYTTRDAASLGHTEVVTGINAGLFDHDLAARPTPD